jgi:molybdopterin synthase sulfur carrier subunit
MRVIVPSHLRSYTNGASEVDARGATLGDVLADLEERFRGLRFRVVDEQDRIRPHVKFFVGGEEADTLDVKVGDREVQIVAALSGG